MREKVNAEKLERFMKEIGRVGKKNARIYLVGDVTPCSLDGARQQSISI